jgi:hypothetical protein
MFSEAPDNNPLGRAASWLPTHLCKAGKKEQR